MFEETVSEPSIWASMNSWLTPTVLFLFLNLVIGTIAFTSSLTHHHHHKNKNHQHDQQQNHLQQSPLVRSPSVLQRLRSINFYSYRSQDQPNPPPPPSSDLFTHYHHDPTHFDFHHTHPQQAPDMETTHFDFQLTHLQQTPETETHFDFQHTHLQQIQEIKTHFDFQQTHLQQIPEMETHFDLPQNHGLQALETETQYSQEQSHGEGGEEEEEAKSMDEIYSQLTGRPLSTVKSDPEPISRAIPARPPPKMRKSASSKSAFGHVEEVDAVEARRPATVREGRARETEVVHEVDAKADDFINKFKQQLKLQRLDSIVRNKKMNSGGGGK